MLEFSELESDEDEPSKPPSKQRRPQDKTQGYPRSECFRVEKNLLVYGCVTFLCSMLTKMTRCSLLPLTQSACLFTISLTVWKLLTQNELNCYVVVELASQRLFLPNWGERAGCVRLCASQSELLFSLWYCYVPYRNYKLSSIQGSVCVRCPDISSRHVNYGARRCCWVTFFGIVQLVIFRSTCFDQ